MTSRTIRKDVVIQISKHYPMTLQESDFDPVEDDNSPLFGRKRGDCPFPFLSATFTAGLDVLLPALYFTCSEYPHRNHLETKPFNASGLFTHFARRGEKHWISTLINSSRTFHNYLREEIGIYGVREKRAVPPECLLQGIRRCRWRTLQQHERSQDGTKPSKSRLCKLQFIRGEGD